MNKWLNGFFWTRGCLSGIGGGVLHHLVMISCYVFRIRHVPNLLRLPRMLQRLSQRLRRESCIFLPLFVFLLASPTSQAEESAIQSPNQAATAPAPAPVPVASTVDIAKRIDPTDFKNRFDLRSEFVDYGTASMQTLVPRFEYAFSKSLGFRTELPIARYDAGD